MEGVVNGTGNPKLVLSEDKLGVVKVTTYTSN